MTSDDTDTDNYSLTPLQREKLSSDSEQGLGTTPGRFLMKIRDQKVEGLNHRFADLFRDIEALSEAGFFSDDEGPGYWTRVETDRETWQDWEWEPFLDEIFRAHGGILTGSFTGKEDSPQSFGRELGQCIRLLSRDILSEEELLDLAFGFLQGLMFDSQTERYSSMEYSPTALFTYVERLEERSVEYYVDEMIEMELQSGLTHRLEKTIHYLNKHGLRLTGYIIDELVQNVDYLPTKEDIEGTDISPPSDDPDEIDQHLSKLKKETDIERIEELMDRVEESVKQLNELKSSVDLVDLFQRVYQSSGKSNRGFERSQLSSSEQNNAVHHLRQFAGEKETSYTWQDFPIVTEENGKWMTTNFGDLVGLQLSSSQPEFVGWMHIYVLDDINTELTDESRTAIDCTLDQLNI